MCKFGSLERFHPFVLYKEDTLEVYRCSVYLGTIVAHVIQRKYIILAEHVCSTEKFKDA